MSLQVDEDMNALIQYFKQDYRPSKKDWVFEGDTYSYNLIHKSTLRIKRLDPLLYRRMELLWRCPGKSNSQIAKEWGMDVSTLLRTWSRALSVLKLYITWPHLCPDLEPIGMCYD